MAKGGRVAAGAAVAAMHHRRGECSDQAGRPKWATSFRQEKATGYLQTIEWLMLRPKFLSSWLAARGLSCRLLAFFLGLTVGAGGALASTMEELSVPSTALGRPISVSIYRPDGPVPKAGWPVLYLLHGLHGNNRDWSLLGSVRETLDRLIAAKLIRPMVVVMPDAGNSWYVDSAAVNGPGNYETAMLDDLPQVIEERFSPHCQRGSRAIAGLSMGGFGALRLALTRPDRFVAVASLSGALWQNIPAGQVKDGLWRGGNGYFQKIDAETVVRGIDLPPEGEHFGGAFGTPFDARRFNQANVFTLLARQVKAQVELPAIYLTVGDKDSHDLWRGSIALFETLMADRVKAELRVTDGDHDWALWRQAIEGALVFVDSKFSAPLPAMASDPANNPKFAGGENVVK